MRCPKCSALNGDEAEFCSLCYHRFAERAEPAAGPASAFFPEVEVLTDGWVFSGCLLARPEGLYVFLRESAYEGKLLGRAVREALDVGAGLVAGPLLKLATLGGGRGRRRPAWLEIRDRQSAILAYDELLAQAPGIVSCRDFFLLPKAELAGLCFHGSELLEVHARGKVLDLRGLGPPEEAARMLLVAGHDSARQPVPRAKRLAYALASLVAAASVVGLIADIREADQAVRWLASKNGPQGIILDGADSVYLVNGREVPGREFKKLPWWDRLPLFKIVGILGLIVVSSLLIAARAHFRP